MFGGEVAVFGKEASPCPPPPLDRTVVVVRVVRILYFNNSKNSTASCVSPVNMVYQCGLWCSWTTHNLSETETRH